MPFMLFHRVMSILRRVEPLVQPFQFTIYDMRIYLRGLYGLMFQKPLHMPDVCPVTQHIGGEGVSHRVWACLDACRLTEAHKGLLYV